MFAQDLEDLPEELREGLADEGQQRQGKPPVATPQSKPQAAQSDRPVSEAQAKMLYAKLKNKGVTPAAFCAHYGIADLKDLPFSQMNPALKAIDAGEIIEPAEAKEEKMPEICSNCGEQIDDNNNGHHPDCPNAVN